MLKMYCPNYGLILNPDALGLAC